SPPTRRSPRSPSLFPCTTLFRSRPLMYCLPRTVRALLQGRCTALQAGQQSISDEKIIQRDIGGSFLFHHQSYERPEKFCIRISERHIKQCGLFQYAFFMSECIESVFAVIFSHTAVDPA